MKQNKKFIISSLLLSLATLSSCSSDVFKFPDDYTESLFNSLQEFAEDNNLTLVEANKEQYYKGIGTGNTIYNKVLDEIYDQIADVAGDTKVEKDGKDGDKIKGKKVYEMKDDFNLQHSVASGFIPNNPSNNLKNRAQKDLLTTAKSSDYVKDNLFYETKMVNDLKYKYNLDSSFDESKVRQNGIIYLPDSEYEDVLSGDYQKYFEKKLYRNLRKKYLTAEYVYTNAYAALGSRLAKKLQVIEIEDRSDELGSALLLINAYIKEYVEGPKAGQDKDFHTLEKLWKGIPADVIEEYNSDGRYNKDGHLDLRYVLTNAEKEFLVDNKLLVVDDNGNTVTAYTQVGKILKDRAKLRAGNNNPTRIDYALEAQYTGNYTYSVDVGIRKALDELIVEDNVMCNIFSDTSTIGNLPQDVKNELFKTANVSTRKADYPTPSDTLPKHGSGTDRTVFEKDGFRYFKNINNGESIYFFDKTTSKYFLIRILDAVDTFALAEGNAESIYDTKEKKEQIAREIAYDFADSGTYTTESNIYWLRRCNFVYKDNDFFEYIKDTYGDVFKTESPYDTYKKLDLSK